MGADTITYDEYDAIPAVRSSDLRLALRSPLHYASGYSGEDTAQRSVLRAIHARVLEPAVYSTAWAVCPVRRDRRTKAYREWMQERPGVEALSTTDSETIEAIAAAIHAHPVAGPLLQRPGLSEHTVQWTDPQTGLACKARLDRVTTDDPSRPWIIDLKGYGTTDLRALARTVARNGAHVQASHYSHGLAATERVPRRQIVSVLVVYETRPPYDVGVVRLHPDGGRYAGDVQRKEAMEVIARAKRGVAHVGRLPELVDLDLPPWAWGDEEEDIMIEGAA